MLQDIVMYLVIYRDGIYIKIFHEILVMKMTDVFQVRDRKIK